MSTLESISSEALLQSLKLERRRHQYSRILLGSRAMYYDVEPCLPDGTIYDTSEEATNCLTRKGSGGFLQEILEPSVICIENKKPVYCKDDLTDAGIVSTMQRLARSDSLWKAETGVARNHIGDGIVQAKTDNNYFDKNLAKNDENRLESGCENSINLKAKGISLESLGKKFLEDLQLPSYDDPISYLQDSSFSTPSRTPKSLLNQAENMSTSSFGVAALCEELPRSSGESVNDTMSLYGTADSVDARVNKDMGMMRDMENYVKSLGINLNLSYDSLKTTDLVEPMSGKVYDCLFEGESSFFNSTAYSKRDEEETSSFKPGDNLDYTSILKDFVTREAAIWRGNCNPTVPEEDVEFQDSQDKVLQALEQLDRQVKMQNLVEKKVKFLQERLGSTKSSLAKLMLLLFSANSQSRYYKNICSDKDGELKRLKETNEQQLKTCTALRLELNLKESELRAKDLAMKNLVEEKASLSSRSSDLEREQLDAIKLNRRLMEKIKIYEDRQAELLQDLEGMRLRHSRAIHESEFQCSERCDRLSALLLEVTDERNRCQNTLIDLLKERAESCYENPVFECFLARCGAFKDYKLKPPEIAQQKISNSQSFIEEEDEESMLVERASLMLVDEAYGGEKNSNDVLATLDDVKNFRSDLLSENPTDATTELTSNKGMSPVLRQKYDTDLQLSKGVIDTAEILPNCNATTLPKTPYSKISKSRAKKIFQMYEITQEENASLDACSLSMKMWHLHELVCKMDQLIKILSQDKMTLIAQIETYYSCDDG